MKRFCFIATLAGFLITGTLQMQAQTTQTKSSQSNTIQTQPTLAKSNPNSAQAQAAQTKLNQVDLMKIWLGTWKAEMGNDITCTIDCKSTYNGFEFHSVIETKGKAIIEWKDLVGYDKRSDRMIEAEIMNNSAEMTLFSFWFTSPTKCQKISLSDDDNSDKSKTNFMYEFKSSDLFTSSEMRNSKLVNSYTFQKIKQ